MTAVRGKRTRKSKLKSRHEQQAGVSFSRTPSSIRDDWTCGLIQPMCCQNIESRRSHSTLLGRAEALS